MPQLSLHTPLGDLTVSEEDGAIVAVDWGWGRDQDQTAILVEARSQLQAYFDGRLTRFDLALAPTGSDYRRRVWAALCDIPSGQTRTYAEIARVAGGAARSVGQANGANPIPVFIPCHRVVAARGANGRWAAGGANGRWAAGGTNDRWEAGGIGGYSAGDGPTTKRFLLQLEARAA